MISEPGRLYTNPVWHVPASIVTAVDAGAGAAFENGTRVAAQLAAVVAILVVLARFALAVWRSARTDPGDGPPVWVRPLVAAWAALFAILAFVPVNTHAWYWTWPVVPIALLVAQDDGDADAAWPRHRWLLPYLALTAILTLVYHTRIVHPG
jgi:hypothetical protein